MKTKWIFILLMPAFVFAGGYAQNREDSAVSKSGNEEIMKIYSDKLSRSVKEYQEALSSILQSDENSYSYSPHYFKLFAPLVLYGSSLNQAFGYRMPVDSTFRPPVSRLKRRDFSASISLKRDRQLFHEINRLLVYTYTYHPHLIAMTEDEMRDVTTYNSDVIKEQEVMNTSVKPDVPLLPTIDDSNAQAVLKKPVYWKTSASFNLKFSQNYFSDNWYKGGESNKSLMTSLEFNLNYSKEKIQFENKFEAWLGFYTSSSDTCHRVKTNNDLLRITSKIGFRAAKNLYYTVNVKAYTQSMAFYETNQTTFKSNFMAPFNANFSAGIDYKPKIKNISSFSIYFSPLSSYNYRFVRYNAPTRDENGNITKQGLATRYYGIRKGRHHAEDFGTRLEITMDKWSIMENVTWRSRFYIYTDYSRTEGEWENSFKFSINRYLSSEVFIHCRFDDNVGVNNYHHKYGYFQVKEYMTLELGYSW